MGCIRITQNGGQYVDFNIDGVRSLKDLKNFFGSKNPEEIEALSFTDKKGQTIKGLSAAMNYLNKPFIGKKKISPPIGNYTPADMSWGSLDLSNYENRVLLSENIFVNTVMDEDTCSVMSHFNTRDDVVWIFAAHQLLKNNDADILAFIKTYELTGVGSGGFDTLMRLINTNSDAIGELKILLFNQKQRSVAEGITITEDTPIIDGYVYIPVDSPDTFFVKNEKGMLYKWEGDKFKKSDIAVGDYIYMPFSVMQSKDDDYYVVLPTKNVIHQFKDLNKPVDDDAKFILLQVYLDSETQKDKSVSVGRVALRNVINGYKGKATVYSGNIAYNINDGVVEGVDNDYELNTTIIDRIVPDDMTDVGDIVQAFSPVLSEPVTSGMISTFIEYKCFDYNNSDGMDLYEIDYEGNFITVVRDGDRSILRFNPRAATDSDRDLVKSVMFPLAVAQAYAETRDNNIKAYSLVEILNMALSNEYNDDVLEFGTRVYNDVMKKSKNREENITNDDIIDLMIANGKLFEHCTI